MFYENLTQEKKTQTWTSRILNCRLPEVAVVLSLLIVLMGPFQLCDTGSQEACTSSKNVAAMWGGEGVAVMCVRGVA